MGNSPGSLTNNQKLCLGAELKNGTWSQGKVLANLTSSDPVFKIICLFKFAHFTTFKTFGFSCYASLSRSSFIFQTIQTNSRQNRSNKRHAKPKLNSRGNWQSK